MSNGQGTGSGCIGTKKWWYQTNGQIHSTPVIGPDGTLYFGSDDGHVYALNSSTQVPGWLYQTFQPTRSTPVIAANGNIYVGSENKNVYCLNGKNGNVIWAYPTLGPIDSSPAIGADGTVYIGSSDHCVYALDGASGALKWKYLTGGPVTASPSVGADGTVYIGSTDSVLYALNGITGKPNWQFSTGGAVNSSVAIDSNNVVYVGSEDSSVRAFHGENGQELWSAIADSPVEASPAVDIDGSVYFGAVSGTFYSINGTNGSVNWVFRATDQIVSSAAIATDGSVYFGSYDKNIYCLNGASGKLNWSYTTLNKIESSPSIGQDGTVYIGSDDNHIYAFATNGPAEVSSNTLNPSTVVAGKPSTGTVTISAPAPTGGAVIILTADNSVATIPASITIPGGSNSATFGVTTATVPGPTVVNIRASYNRTSVIGQLTINPGNIRTLTLNPTMVIGGTPSIGTVTLDGLAPVGGLDVAVTSNNGNATTSQIVTVQAGQKSANFTVSTVPVSSQVTATITVKLNNTSQNATLSVVPPTAGFVSLNPSSVAGGASSTGTVTLTGPAPPGGASVYLTTSNPTALVPTSVSVASGQISTTFSVTTKFVTAPVSVTVTANLNLGAATATLAIVPISLSSVVVAPSTLGGGMAATGAVTLTGPATMGGATIQLSSSGKSAIVPASIKVATGQSTTTFAVKTTAVATQTLVVISAKMGSSTTTTTLTLQPPSLASVKLNPTTVIGGSASVGTVNLAGVAPTGGLTIKLLSDQNAAIAPSSVVVAAGKSSATFSIKTIPVGSVVAANIQATLNGAKQSGVLTISPPSVLSLTISPISVKGGKSATGTVKISGPAPSGGLIVMTSSNQPSAQVQQSVTIPAGKTTATFTIQTSTVSTKTQATISATTGGASKTALLTIT